ncbi:hypothetical protein JAAARDRAFT_193200 [Jaapia argillacea MUCL 33604]|uniref:DNA mismatch repair protein n=1 Tax=Jaapia argillacea MUCL 33604 TaxID=933084 RepID=A0A067Q7T6_9AGAM|nr:hypothetical protein JAAARDRAFT_193200 [Jaapia argillacea MUCL 33604]
MSFFAKPSASASAGSSSNSSSKPSKPIAQPKPAPKASSSSDLAPSSSPSLDLATPAKPKSISSSSSGLGVTSATYTRFSDGSAKDTPPTSDPVDVEMIEDDEAEEAELNVKASSSRPKRKIVIEDSDEEESELNKKSSSVGGLGSSSPLASVVRSRAKKARLSVAPSSEDEDEADEEAIVSFSKRITHFKKASPKGKPKGKKSHASSDDDDFIVPDSPLSEEDDDGEADDKRSRTLSSRSRSRSSSTSSQSLPALSDDEDDEEAPRKSAAKKKPAKKSTAGGAAVSGGGDAGGNSSFLTAAEQRALTQKKEKKSSDEAYAFLSDLRDKDGNRPSDAKYDPRTLYVPKSAWADFTPFEKQFWEIKQNHWDTILFFQKGKFFELYEEDARIGHREFDLKLTSRVKMCMVGVPEMSFNFWAAKFLAKGYKVGRVDQAETALGAEMRMSKGKGGKGKGEDKAKDKIVRRELNKIYTNGTLVDDELLSDEQAGHCVSIREEGSSSGERDSRGEKSSFGICVLDSATSEFNLSSFEDDICRTKLETMIRQLRPKEVVVTKDNLSVHTTRLLKSILPASCLWTTLREREGFGYDKTLKEVKQLYAHSEDVEAMEEDEDNGEDGLGANVPEAIRSMADSRNAIEALGAMIWYLRQLNIDKEILSMKNFNVYDPMKRGQGLVLDGQTLAHIEVLLNNEGTEEGSLLQLLGRCVTPFGKRLFRIWLCMPLREVADVNARLDAVQGLIDNPEFEKEFDDLAKGLPDLERIVSRVHAKNCKVKDFLKLLSAFKKLSKGISKLANATEAFESKNVLGLLRSAPDLLSHIEHVEMMFEKPEKDGDELVPQDGKDEVYDGVMAEIAELENELSDKLKGLEKDTGMSLTYWHSAIGTKDIYLVQTPTKGKNINIPKSWIKNGGTKAANRWTVPSLLPTIRLLKEARENRNTAIKDFKGRLYTEFDADRATWLRAIRVFAELDCLFSLAKASTALGEPVCRPEFIEGDAAWLEFKELRHPALCVRTKGDFIPNDVKLGKDVGRIALLTGPNMGGKSTLMRMTAAGVIMAQLGMMVPAAKARLCPVDAILTRMGAYDSMFTHASTFKVELDECSKILRDATPRSLVILDELGRGTSTYDGMAIAGAVLHQLATHSLPLSFFATHYGSLTDDFAYHPNIRNMHVETLVDDEKRELVFLYKLVDGVAESSFGTHVANLAGVPLEVVKRAGLVSDDFARQFKQKIEGKKQKTRLPLVAQADFVYLHGLAMGKFKMPENPVLQREVLRIVRAAAQKYVPTT